MEEDEYQRVSRLIKEIHNPPAKKSDIINKNEGRKEKMIHFGVFVVGTLVGALLMGVVAGSKNK